MAFDPARRGFLTARPAAQVQPLRPPWADRADMVDDCTRCGKCLAACPEGVLASDDAGFPTIDFSAGSGECTFCRACAEACPEPVFAAAADAPWSLRPAIGDGCLARRGVHCQSCGDACPTAALSFPPRLGGPPAPRLDADACTGCGACLRGCPVGALTMERGETLHA